MMAAANAHFVRVDSHPSLPGLTRQSIFLRRKRWTTRTRRSRVRPIKVCKSSKLDLRWSSPRVTVSTRGPISPESALMGSNRQRAARQCERTHGPTAPSYGDFEDAPLVVRLGLRNLDRQT